MSSEMTVLTSVKEMIGLPSDYSVRGFDLDILSQIQSAVDTLYQLGAIATPIEITITTTFNDLNIPSNIQGMVKQYITLKTKQVFDPTGSSIVAQAYDARIKELEWRLNVGVDPGEESNE